MFWLLTHNRTFLALLVWSWCMWLDMSKWWTCCNLRTSNIPYMGGKVKKEHFARVQTELCGLFEHKLQWILRCLNTGNRKRAENSLTTSCKNCRVFAWKCVCVTWGSLRSEATPPPPRELLRTKLRPWIPGRVYLWTNRGRRWNPGASGGLTGPSRLINERLNDHSRVTRVPVHDAEPVCVFRGVKSVAGRSRNSFFTGLIGTTPPSEAEVEA